MLTRAKGYEKASVIGGGEKRRGYLLRSRSALSLRRSTSRSILPSLLNNSRLRHALRKAFFAFAEMTSERSMNPAIIAQSRMERVMRVVLLYMCANVKGLWKGAF